MSKPCKNCGGNDRYVVATGKTGPCIPCSKRAGKLWHRNNRIKSIDRTRTWKTENSEKQAESTRRYNLARRGITPEEYDEKLRQQGNRCDCCKTLEPGGRGRFHVDHCHNTGIVRGLLCSGCNTGTGITDSIELLKLKIEYLVRWTNNQS